MISAEISSFLIRVRLKTSPESPWEPIGIVGVTDDAAAMADAISRLV